MYNLKITNVERKLISFIMLFFVLAAHADNENTLQYGWTQAADGSYVKKVTGAGSAKGIVVVPKEVDGYPVIEIGENAFYSNSGITEVFLPNSITKIGNKAFWNCTKLEHISLGNSLKTIGDLAFQYCRALQDFTLPNTIESVGDHFLCSCDKLTSLVIPEKLTTIGEYFLHGCEGLRAVYLMGTEKRTLGRNPFFSQVQQGLRQVHDCVFYVDNEQVYKNNYQTSGNWRYADQANTDHLADDGNYKNGGNRYSWGSRPDDIRPYKAEWITVCYPTETDAARLFGDGALVAEMGECRYAGKDAQGNWHYHISFKDVPSKIMKAHTPYLLKADPKNIGSSFIVRHIEKESEITDERLSTTVRISNQEQDPSAAVTSIRMLGTYRQGGRNLKPGEFLFSNQNGKLKFYKQLEGGKQRRMGTYRCYWQIIKDNHVANDAKIGMFEETATGLTMAVEAHDAEPMDVYSPSGQLVRAKAVDTSDLPAGIYIVKGKKVLVR